jgi:hypothetical protein
MTKHRFPQPQAALAKIRAGFMALVRRMMRPRLAIVCLVGSNAIMSPRRTRCLAPVLTAVLSAQLAACALSGGGEPSTDLSDPGLATRPSTAGVVDNTQLPKAAGPAKTAARAEPAKPAVRAEPARPAAKTEVATATKTDVAPCASGGGCVTQLKRMVDGTNRTWIGRPEPPQQFADGTRLFAYRALRPNLSCRELSLALTEIDTSSKRLLDPASAVGSDRAQRVAALATDVAAELRSEHAGRCTAAGTRTTAAGAEPAQSQ